MTNDNDEGHANRQNCDIAHLVDQVADISGGDKDAVRRNSEEDHNNDQRNEHKVLADIRFQDIQKALGLSCFTFCLF